MYINRRIHKNIIYIYIYIYRICGIVLCAYCQSGVKVALVEASSVLQAQSFSAVVALMDLSHIIT